MCHSPLHHKPFRLTTEETLFSLVYRGLRQCCLQSSSTGLPSAILQQGRPGRTKNQQLQLPRGGLNPKDRQRLHKLSHKSGENLRKFMQRFFQVLHTIPKIIPEAIVSTYHVVAWDPVRGKDEHERSQHHFRVISSGR
jgi:hypothetical protein